MRERFVVRWLLVSLPTIFCENTCIENELVCVVKDLLGGVGRGTRAVVDDCVVDLTPYNLEGVSRGVCLAEALVLCKPVDIGDDGVSLV